MGLNPGQDAGLKAKFEHKILEALKAQIPGLGAAVMAGSVMKCGPSSMFSGGVGGLMSSLRRLDGRRLSITSAVQSMLPLGSATTVPAVSGALAASTGLPAGLASEATNYLGQGSPAISGGPLAARNIGAAPYVAPTYPPTTEEDSSGSGALLGLIPLCLLCCCCLLALAALAALAMMMMKKKKKKKKALPSSSSSWDEQIATQR